MFEYVEILHYLVEDFMLLGFYTDVLVLRILYGLLLIAFMFSVCNLSMVLFFLLCAYLHDVSNVYELPYMELDMKFFLYLYYKYGNVKLVVEVDHLFI